MTLYKMGRKKGDLIQDGEKGELMQDGEKER